MIHNTLLIRPSTKEVLAGTQYWPVEVSEEEIQEFNKTREELEEMEGSVSELPLIIGEHKFLSIEVVSDLLLVFITDKGEDERTISDRLHDGASTLRKHLSRIGLPALIEDYDNLIEPAVTIRLKIALVGEGGVGKTTTLHLLLGDTPPLSYVPTIALNLETVENIRFGNYSLVLWDFAGQERFRTLWRFYFHGADVIFLVCDSSLRNVIISKDILKLIKRDAPKVPVFAMANKQDKPNAMKPEVVQKILGVPTYPMVAIDKARRDEMLRILMTAAAQYIGVALPDLPATEILRFTEIDEREPVDILAEEEEEEYEEIVEEVLVDEEGHIIEDMDEYEIVEEIVEVVEEEEEVEEEADIEVEEELEEEPIEEEVPEVEEEIAVEVEALEEIEEEVLTEVEEEYEEEPEEELEIEEEVEELESEVEVDVDEEIEEVIVEVAEEFAVETEHIEVEGAVAVEIEETSPDEVEVIATEDKEVIIEPSPEPAKEVTSATEVDSAEMAKELITTALDADEIVAAEIESLSEDDLDSAIEAFSSTETVPIEGETEDMSPKSLKEEQMQELDEILGVLDHLKDISDFDEEEEQVHIVHREGLKDAPQSDENYFERIEAIFDDYDKNGEDKEDESED
jgi:small GTP-binding protein